MQLTAGRVIPGNAGQAIRAVSLLRERLQQAKTGPFEDDW
jgi:hypothetical protein